LAGVILKPEVIGMPAAHILHDIIASIDGLTPFPRIARRALELAADAEVNVEELIDVVQYDPVITAKCLRLCNSSYFWIKEEVVSLRRAVVILGTRNILKILLAHCIKMPEYTASHRGYGLEAGALWRHSMASAVLAGQLANAAGFQDDASLFTAALLHDVGKLVLNPFVENSAGEMEALLNNGQSVMEAEKALFEINHAELGAMIAAGWNFPAVLVDSIRDHHADLTDTEPSGIEAWVALTNQMAHVCTLRSACQHLDAVICDIKPAVLAHFDLKPADIDSISKHYRDEMKQLDSLF
jgi:putative nucleotidyltransferase with HDIG domain